MSETSPARVDSIASIKIFGRVAAPDFPRWITRHAAKLGLYDLTISLHLNRLDVTATGHFEMLEALALACSLGPRSALVDRVGFTTEAVPE